MLGELERRGLSLRALLWIHRREGESPVRTAAAISEITGLRPALNTIRALVRAAE